MSDDPNDRASRLAGRWGAGGEEEESPDESPDETAVGDDDIAAVTENSGDGAAGDGGEGASESPDDGGDGELTTREMQSQMLYLPPEFHKKLDLTFEELNLRFRRERDRKLQKNKDFYAGLLRLGLERLQEVEDEDLETVEELLEL